MCMRARTEVGGTHAPPPPHLPPRTARNALARRGTHRCMCMGQRLSEAGRLLRRTLLSTRPRMRAHMRCLTPHTCLQMGTQLRWFAGGGSAHTHRSAAAPSQPCLPACLPRPAGGGRRVHLQARAQRDDGQDARDLHRGQAGARAHWARGGGQGGGGAGEGDGAGAAGAADGGGGKSMGTGEERAGCTGQHCRRRGGARTARQQFHAPAAAGAAWQPVARPPAPTPAPPHPPPPPHRPPTRRRRRRARA